MDDQGVVRNEQPPAQDGPSQQDQDGPHKKEAADDGSTPGDGTPGDGTPDDGSADKSQDLADAEQQTRDALAPFGDDAPTVDFSSNPIDPATVREINNAVQRLGADYPSTMQGLSHIGSQDFNQSLGPNNGDVLAYATPQDSSPGIYISEEAFSDNAARAEDGADEEATGFTVPGGGSAEGVFTHEFGHHLAQQLLDNPQMLADLNRAVSNAIGVPYDATQPHDAATQQRVENALSTYGSNDSHEMMAEAFTEYRLAENPRALAQAIGQVMDRHLGANSTGAPAPDGSPGGDGNTPSQTPDGGNTPEGTSQPTPNENQPGSGESPPPADEGQPRPGDDQPRSDNGQLRPGEDQPRTDDGQPRAENGQPRTDEGQPRTDDGQPRPGEDQPRTDNDQPRAEDGQPRTDEAQPRPGDDQPRTDDGQPRPGDDQPRTDSGQSRTEEGQPRSHEEQPRTDGGQSRDGEGQPRARDGQPREGDDGRSSDGQPTRGDEPPPGLPGHLHDAWRNSADTPAGRALYGPDEPYMRNTAGMVPPDPAGRFVLDAHGNSDGPIVGDRPMSATDLAALIRSDPNWNGRDLLLLSNNTGDGRFASDLAQNLGVRVTAPTGAVDVDARGNPESSGWTVSNPDGTTADPDPVRRFTSDAEGQWYGDNRLGEAFRNLPPHLQNALYQYTVQSMPNAFLRPGADLAGALNHFQNDFNRAWALARMNDGTNLPTLDDLQRWSSHPNLSPEQRDLINNVLNDSDPDGRLDQIRQNAGYWSFLHDYFGGTPTVDAFNARIGELDQALNQRLPEPVQTERGLHDVSFMRLPDGTALGPRDAQLLIGSIQTEPAYMSTSLGQNPAVVDGQPFSYRIHMDLPEGSNGVWMGGNSAYPDQRELVLPRGTRYQITSVDTSARDADGNPIVEIRATVIPPGAPDPGPLDTSGTSATPPAGNTGYAGSPPNPGPAPGSGTPPASPPHSGPPDPGSSHPGPPARFRSTPPPDPGTDTNPSPPPDDGNDPAARGSNEPAARGNEPTTPGTETAARGGTDPTPGNDPGARDGSATPARGASESAASGGRGGGEPAMRGTDDGASGPGESGARGGDGPAARGTDGGAAPRTETAALGGGESAARGGNEGAGRSGGEPAARGGEAAVSSGQAPARGGNEAAARGPHDPAAPHEGDAPPAGLPDHLHDVYRESQETPAGRAFYGPDEGGMRDLAGRVPADPQRFVVDGHGDADGMRVGGRRLSVDDVADLIRNDPNWNGREVMLLSCETGDGQFATQLAQRLGVPVTAPNGLAWSDSDGNVYAASGRPGEDGRTRPDLPPNGGWQTHRPNGDVAPAGRDGYAPGHPVSDAPRAGDGDETRGSPAQHPWNPPRVDPADTRDHALRPGEHASTVDYPPREGRHRILALDDDGNPVLDEQGRQIVRSIVYTNADGQVTHVTNPQAEGEPAALRNPNENIDLTQPEPGVVHQVDFGHGDPHVFVGGDDGRSPAAAPFDPPTHTAGGEPLQHVTQDGYDPARGPYSANQPLQPDARIAVYDNHSPPRLHGIFWTDADGNITHVRTWFGDEDGAAHYNSELGVLKHKNDGVPLPNVSYMVEPRDRFAGLDPADFDPVDAVRRGDLGAQRVPEDGDGLPDPTAPQRTPGPDHEVPPGTFLFHTDDNGQTDLATGRPDYDTGGGARYGAQGHVGKIGGRSTPGRRSTAGTSSATRGRARGSASTTSRSGRWRTRARTSTRSRGRRAGTGLRSTWRSSTRIRRTTSGSTGSSSSRSRTGTPTAISRTPRR
ncbi:hypothetical protein LUW74_29425 [Actinomadura madurae]|uniref:ADP-ribosyltransferase n=1 Tax=Actinomadura madurae TaxID=1993 RepID=UPI002025CC26|nr:ADP-ribosyltransferase [Actinomadura madurae]URN07043.1 hypothetical protein LUW74_29425 [Actinomadura madurae]